MKYYYDLIEILKNDNNLKMLFFSLNQLLV